MKIWLGWAKRAAMLAAAGTMVAGCDWMNKKDPPGAKSEKELAAERDARLRRACASEATYDRLKELAFDQAARIRNQDPRDLDALATASVVRMEKPVVKSRDEALNVTVCTGRFILELPPGAENAFDGERRLSADIEYSAQAAVDGSGLVYHMDGAEPLIYRLATAGGLPVRTAAAPVPAPTPAAAPPPPPAEARPQPAPRPTPAPQAEAKAPQPERQAARPSFNCNHARTRSERMVCGSGALAARDREMSSLFYRALADADGATRRELRSTRDAFLAYRERCASEACVAQAYEGRMREIRDIMAGR
ncbi:MAG: lysozyme inhibitor LprI family protein [Allosphingosinicella sp.]|uniref:lysozyme inhibitor LprI family protein n=1 Tax=Allosphingosinicella sp. TaxID=2823234 RepID=UPI0039464AE3